ncbi:MAG: precorrin-6y C5,15-methyltransferase (decarboxylating) subunit CbiE [Candidatus Manganitrophus sp. SB1]|nr:precorrin-6y C5,15-methyltransferase (decarboxylating) subunit CbiE [Candidatus Manganitrophus morganii]
MGDPLKEKVHVFGVGEDGVLSMNLKAMRLLQDAEWIFGPERLLAFFPNHDAKKIPIQSDLKKIAEMIQSNLGRRQMAVLASGDPNFYGIAQGLVAQLGKEAVEILPNVSAMQLAFARIKESWEEAYLGSVRNRPIEGVIEPVRHAVKAGILTDAENTPAALAKALLARGIENRTAYVCENLGEGDERVTELDLKQLPGRNSSPRTILILLDRIKQPSQKPPQSDTGKDALSTSNHDEEGRI